MKRGLLIPDTQHGPGRPDRHLTWLSRFIEDKRFDVIIHAGDLGDFSSLSSYDKGKASAENRRLSKDWDAYRLCVDRIMADWERIPRYKPRLVYTEGNHEERVRRYQHANPEIDTLPNPCAYMESRGWESYSFQQVAKVEGCLVSHFFPKTLKGTITGSSMRMGPSSAENMIRANMASCIAGHKPGIDWAVYPAADKMYHGLIAGSFYLHKEAYMGPQQRYWRGVVVLNRLRNGQFDPCPVSIDYLKEKYG